MGLVADECEVQRSPVTFQLKVPWESATPEEKTKCHEKAKEDCHLVYNIIAPDSGTDLYECLTSPSPNEPTKDMKLLMTAYKNAKTSGLRTQILSLYAFRYPVHVLMKLHEPYAKLTRYQVKRARTHAKLHGSGAAL